MYVYNNQCLCLTVNELKIFLLTILLDKKLKIEQYSTDIGQIVNLTFIINT